MVETIQKPEVEKRVGWMEDGLCTETAYNFHQYFIH